MADVAKRIVGPLYMATTNSVVYTVPTATTTIVRNIHVMNNSTSATLTFNLAINGTSATASNCLYFQHLVPSQGAFDWSGFLVLAAGDVLQGLCSGASGLTLAVSAVESS